MTHIKENFQLRTGNLTYNRKNNQKNENFEGTKRRLCERCSQEIKTEKKGILTRTIKTLNSSDNDCEKLGSQGNMQLLESLGVSALLTLIPSLLSAIIKSREFGQFSLDFMITFMAICVLNLGNEQKETENKDTLAEIILGSIVVGLFFTILTATIHSREPNEFLIDFILYSTCKLVITLASALRTNELKQKVS